MTNAVNTTIADAQGVGTINDNDQSSPAPNISINSTSQDSVGPNRTAVPQQSQVANTTYSVLAINDLGMHCGDLDTRIASTLPPFQVLLAQVIQKGARPVLNPAGVSVAYSAVANANDPILGQSTAFTGVKVNGSTYKTNFWDGVSKGTYDPFYPGGLGITPLATGGFPVTPDVGLPVPNVENLYIGPDGIVDSPAGQPGSHDGFLSAIQHAMPGITNPYVANVPQIAEEHYTNKPFFVNFPFGYVAAGVNWFEAAGVPFAAFDDFGRENAYPLVRVQAKSGKTVLSTVDTVLPISGEANCTNCHALNADYRSVHGCQVCHYTPALGLAHVGPKAGAAGTEANGRNQLAHQSNSRVMHNHHGAITALDRNGVAMFPNIPAPIQNQRQHAASALGQRARLRVLPYG